VSVLVPGQPPVREAIHAVFFCSTPVKAGLDMGRSSIGGCACALRHRFDAELRDRIEDVVLNRREERRKGFWRSTERFNSSEGTR